MPAQTVALAQSGRKTFVIDGVTNMDSPTIGTLADGRFHHTLTGIGFTVPQGWKVQRQGQSSGGGSIHDKLIGSMNFKAGQHSDDPTYTMLRSTASEKTVAGHPALSVSATFVRNGVNMIEFPGDSGKDQSDYGHVSDSAKLWRVLVRFYGANVLRIS